MIVRLRRSLRRGDVGKDVLAVQRALRAAGCRKRRPTGIYDGRTAQDVGRFQQRHHQHVDGVYGARTHRKLAGYFDRYGAYLMEHAVIRPPVRERIVAVALFGYNHRDEIGYTQGWERWDGIRNHRKPPLYPREADCSSFAEWCYWVAGAPDPSAGRYQGGSTATMVEHGRQVGAPELGDLVFYSYPDHVAVYVGRGKVVSHGSWAGPSLCSLRYRDPREFRSYL